MPLQEVSILVCEDEPLIAYDLLSELEEAGARVILAHEHADGLKLATSKAFDIAVLDHRLNDVDSTEIAAALDRRGIPYLIHSGFIGAGHAKHVPKPAPRGLLIQRLEELLSERGARGFATPVAAPDA